MPRYIAGMGLAFPIALAITLSACEGTVFQGVPDFQEMCSARHFEGDVYQEFPSEWVDDGHFKNLRFDLTTGTFEMDVEIWNLGPSAQREYHPGEGCAYRGMVGGHISGARQGGIEWEGHGMVEATTDAPGCPSAPQPLSVSLVLSDSCDATIGYWIHNAADVGGQGKFVSTRVGDEPLPNPEDEPPTPEGEPNGGGDDSPPPHDEPTEPEQPTEPGDASPPPHDEPTPSETYSPSEGDGGEPTPSPTPV